MMSDITNQRGPATVRKVDFTPNAPTADYPTIAPVMRIWSDSQPKTLEPTDPFQDIIEQARQLEKYNYLQATTQQKKHYVEGLRKIEQGAKYLVHSEVALSSDLAWVQQPDQSAVPIHNAADGLVITGNFYGIAPISVPGQTYQNLGLMLLDVDVRIGGSDQPHPLSHNYPDGRLPYVQQPVGSFHRALLQTVVL